MEELHWPLSVLSRCINYKNMSGAAQNIGISQPQISRLIKKLEDQLEITLLDRSSPRHSKWTSDAWKLVDIYTRSSRSLDNSLNQLKIQSLPKVISVGSLEGLIPQALKFIRKLEQAISFEEIHLDIYDQNEMESNFLNGDLDLIFTSRVPGKSKPRNLKIIGHQTLKQFTDKGLEVLSPFEFKTRTNKKSKKLISNSLNVRSTWLQSYGGKGQLPGSVKSKKEENDLEALVIGKETLHIRIWEIV